MVLIIGVQFIIIAYASFFSKFDPFLQFVFLIMGFSFLFTYWKQGGMFIQKYFTTVNPPDSYIKSGIKAGNEILKRYKEDYDPKSPSLLLKIWNMGIIQIIFGFVLANYIFDIIL